METSKNQADSTLDFPNQFVVIIFLTLFCNKNKIFFKLREFVLSTNDLARYCC
jgi:hypothetical protein